jgi:hypothetical protein
MYVIKYFIEALILLLRWFWWILVLIGVVYWLSPLMMQEITKLQNSKPDHLFSDSDKPVDTAIMEHVVYIPGMRITSFDDFRDALLDAFRQNHTRFEVEFTGSKQELAIAYAFIDNYYDPHRIISMNSATSPRTSAIRAAIMYATRSNNALYVQQRVKKLVKEQIASDMSNHQKIRVLHDWIVRNAKYDTSLTRYDAYDILVDGTAVCQGYALLLDMLLTEAGLNTIYVTGNVKPAFLTNSNSTSDGGHAWNMVKIDGYWYHLDATWNDPTPDQPDNVSYNYYMLTDAEIGITRTFDDSFSNYLRPTSEIPYFAVLQSALTSDVRYTTQIRQIIKDTYMLYVTDDTMFSDNDLQRFTTYIDQFTDIPFVFRAVNKSVVPKLIQHYMQLKGVNVRYSTAPYPRTINPDDVLVEVYVTQQVVQDTYPQYANDDVLFGVGDLQRFTAYINQFTGTPFVFRAVNESDVSTLIQHYVQLKKISVSYSIMPYPRTINPDDVLVEVFPKK